MLEPNDTNNSGNGQDQQYYVPQPEQEQYYVPQPEQEQYYVPQPEQEQYYASQPEQEQYYATQPGQEQYYATQPGQEQYYTSLPEQEQYYASQPEQEQYYPSQPEQEQYYASQPGQEQYYATQPGQEQYYPPQPEQEQYYASQPGQEQYYPSQPGQEQYYASQPEQEQYYASQPEQEQYYASQPEQEQYYASQPEQEQYYAPQPDQEQSYSPEAQYAAESISPEKNKGQSFFGKMRSRFSVMLASMKQAPEAEEDNEADEAAAAPSEDSDTPVKRGIFSNLSLDSLERQAEQPEEVSPETVDAEDKGSRRKKAEKTEGRSARRSFFKSLSLDSFEQREEGADDATPYDTPAETAGEAPAASGNAPVKRGFLKNLIYGSPEETDTYAEPPGAPEGVATVEQTEPADDNAIASQLTFGDTVQTTEKPVQPEPALAEQPKDTAQVEEKPQTAYYPWSREEAPVYEPWDKSVQITEKPAQPDPALAEQPVQSLHEKDNTKTVKANTDTAEAAQNTEENNSLRQENIIYKAPERKAPPKPAPTTAKKQPASKAAPERPSPQRRELPAFDIFAEFAREQQQKKKEVSDKETEEKQQTKTAAAASEQTLAEKDVSSHTQPEAAPEAAQVKTDKESDAPKAEAAGEITEKTEQPLAEKSSEDIKEKTPTAAVSTEQNDTEEKHAEKYEKPVDERPAEKEPEKEEPAENKPVKDNILQFTRTQYPADKETLNTVKSDNITPQPDDDAQLRAEMRNEAVPIDSLPVDRDMPDRIPDNVIYDAQPSDEPDEEKDLTEGRPAPVSYHYSDAAPFIVMAGKFTRTLRAEYETARALRNAQLEAERKAQAEKAAQKQAHEKKLFSSLMGEKRSQPKPQKKATPANESKQKHQKKGEGLVIKTKQPHSPAPQSKAKPPAAKKSAPSSPLMEILEPSPAAAVVPSEGEVLEKKKKTRSKAERLSAAKSRKDKKRFRFSELFSDEEEYDPDDVPPHETEPKAQLDDYNEESDADAIRTEINSNFQTVFARTITLLAASVVSIILSLIAQCTSLFSETIRNGWLWYAVISFVLFVVAVIAARSPIMNGLMPLRRFKGNSDTAVAAASAACAMQGITALFTPDLFLSGQMFIYTPLVIFALFCNSAGKLLIITRTHNNFSFLTKPYPKYAGKIFTDKTNADKMAKELPVSKPIIGYTRRAKFLSNFLQLSYAPDPSEQLAARIAPWTTAFSLACGLLYGLIYRSFIGGLSSFALTACMSIPVICLLAVNIPLRRLCHTSLKNGAMITSYETVKQFCDTNAIMIDSSQLYPKGSVTLSGMKSFKQTMLNDALLAGAAIMNAVNGTMIHVFENIVQCSKNMLPRVDNVIYEDGRGLEGWVRGQRVLIGNRELLISHNIEPPEKEVEERYFKLGNEITYITVGGELIAMFILSYKTTKHIASELRALEDNGVSFIVRTVDANLTREFIAEHFGLFHRCINVVPTSLGNVCSEAMSGTDDRSRAYLMTRGKLSSFARAVSGCIKMKSNVTISKILQMIALGLGLVMITLISFVSGFEKLGCLEMLIYTAFWSLTSIIAAIIRK